MTKTGTGASNDLRGLVPQKIYTVMIREWHTWLDFSSVLTLINMA